MSLTPLEKMQIQKKCSFIILSIGVDIFGILQNLGGRKKLSLYIIINLIY